MFDKEILDNAVIAYHRGEGLVLAQFFKDLQHEVITLTGSIPKSVQVEITRPVQEDPELVRKAKIYYKEAVRRAKLVPGIFMHSLKESLKKPAKK